MAAGQRADRQEKLAARCRRKFLRYFKGGFKDETYLDWERNFKWEAHLRWEGELGRGEMEGMLARGRYREVAERAVKIESRTMLLFSFEKMAIRDAIKPAAGAKAFARGLFAYLHESEPLGTRFDMWCEVVAGLPRRQTRVLTWPIATVFGFLAQPKRHFFLKPNVTRRAAEAYGWELEYESRPSWRAYERVLRFAAAVRRDLRDLKPRDMIDVQGFLWVQGSDEYPV